MILDQFSSFKRSPHNDTTLSRAELVECGIAGDLKRFDRGRYTDFGIWYLRKGYIYYPRHISTPRVPQSDYYPYITLPHDTGTRSTLHYCKCMVAEISA